MNYLNRILMIIITVMGLIIMSGYQDKDMILKGAQYDYFGSYDDTGELRLTGEMIINFKGIIIENIIIDGHDIDLESMRIKQFLFESITLPQTLDLTKDWYRVEFGYTDQFRKKYFSGYITKVAEGDFFNDDRHWIKVDSVEAFNDIPRDLAVQILLLNDIVFQTPFIPFTSRLVMIQGFDYENRVIFHIEDPNQMVIDIDSKTETRYKRKRLNNYDLRYRWQLTPDLDCGILFQNVNITSNIAANNDSEEFILYVILLLNSRFVENNGDMPKVIYDSNQNIKIN